MTHICTSCAVQSGMTLDGRPTQWQSGKCSVCGESVTVTATNAWVRSQEVVEDSLSKKTATELMEILERSVKNLRYATEEMNSDFTDLAIKITNPNRLQ